MGTSAFVNMKAPLFFTGSAGFGPDLPGLKGQGVKAFMQWEAPLKAQAYASCWEDRPFYYALVACSCRC